MGIFVYILQSRQKDRYYVGQSEHPHLRLRYHNTIEKGYTSRYRPWELVYVRECSGRPEARELERKIKRWKSRSMIAKLIRGEIAV